MGSSMHKKWTRVLLVGCGVILGFASTGQAGGFFEDLGKAVEKGVEAVKDVGEKAATTVGEIANGGGQILKDVGTALEETGGDGAKLVGGALKGAGSLATEGAASATGIAVTGVIQPSASLANSLVDTATTLATLDLSSPEKLDEGLHKAATSASGLILSAERTIERATMDIESISLEALPDPLESGVRHLAAEPLKEIEKKNPQLARTLRYLPVTSNLYNHLRHLAKDEWVCQPETIFPKLDEKVRPELKEFARLSSAFTTPGAKGQGLSGWTATNCRATALGIAEYDAVHSADNLITIDLRLVSLNVGGRSENVVGRYLRVEVLPIGRAHQFATFHRIRKGESLLVSGEIFRDEDFDSLVPLEGEGFWELHPVDDLEVVSVPKRETDVSEPPVAEHFAPPERTGEAARFGLHIVSEGESLSSIAQRYYGVQRWPVLQAANRTIVRAADLIQPGWRLNIPVRTDRGVAMIGAAESNASAASEVLQE